MALPRNYDVFEVHHPNYPMHYYQSGLIVISETYVALEKLLRFCLAKKLVHR